MNDIVAYLKGFEWRAKTAFSAKFCEASSLVALSIEVRDVRPSWIFIRLIFRHLLVVPNRHVERFADLTKDEAGDLFSTGQEILKAIQISDVRCDGANLLLSDGSVAGQEVGHSHLHIVPRFNGDGQKVGFKHASLIANERLDAIASIIKENL